jgi:uncharacterized phage protein (TIGR01671 family)
MQNRKIKFRVWKPNTKEWVQNNMLFEFACETRKFNEVFTDRNDCYGDNFLIFQQFTGLIDKKGKEIYEGDIVKWTHPMTDIGEVKYAIKNQFGSYPDTCFFGVHCTRMTGISHFQIDDEYEVIGNAFENPELLTN